MAWHISGDYYAPCSCNVGCPCIFGELEADRGWCSGVLALNVRAGEVDGTDVSGARVVLVADWPRGFLAGDGTGRVYFDPSVRPEQRTALAELLGGRRGGVFEAIASLVPTIEPPQEAPIEFRSDGDATQIRVGDVLDVNVKPLVGATGERTRVLHGAATFRDDIYLGKSSGRASPPGMRQWEFGGHAEMQSFDWNA
jgi:hypothetical protein